MKLDHLPFWALSAFLGSVAARRSTLEWSKREVKAVGERFICTESDFGPSRGHQLHLTRCSRGHPTAHIFAVGPAPGDDGSYWIDRLDDMEKIYGTDFVLYAASLRGSEGASHFTDSARDMSWTRSDFEDTTTTDGKLELDRLHLDGLAADLEDLIEAVKEEAGFVGSVYLHARSFGAQIAERLMTRNKSLLKGVLIESGLPRQGLFEVHNDAEFLELCAQDDFCKARFGGMDPKLARNIISSLSSPGYNGCADAILEALRKKDKPELSLLLGGESEFLALSEFLTPFLHGKISTQDAGVHPALLVMPFLSAAYTCPDVQKFKTTILPAMIDLYKKCPASRFEPFERGDPKMNRFANAWLMNKEVLGMGKEDKEKKHVCHTPTPLGLTMPCVLYKHYHTYYKAMKGALGNPSPREESPFKHDGQIIFVGGALDLLCPLSSATKAYGKAEGSKKRLIKLTGLGHHPLSESKCARQIGTELLGRGDASATDSCVGGENSAKSIIWKQIKPDWWAGSAKSSAASSSSGKTKQGKEAEWTLWQKASLVAIFVLAAVLLLALMWILGRRSVTTNSSIISNP